MKIKTSLFVFAAGLTGCATMAPPQLVEARDAYATSSGGLAGKMAPTEMYDAKKVLDKANAEFEENGDSLEARDYAYVAHRKIQLADVKARAEVDRLKIADAEKQGVKVRDSQVKNTQAALATTREQLKDERTASAAQGKELEKTAAQLESEKQARLTAEGKLAGAMKDLASIAAVKEEPRGVVITLSGGVLFPSGKYTLLETAKTKLDQVADALKQQNADQTMVVEGHTDSQGSDATNQPLSLNRANSVREYLVSRGVDAAKINAVGLSSSRPLVDNKSVENRSNNRRVEIIIRPSQVSAL